MVKKILLDNTAWTVREDCEQLVTEGLPEKIRRPDRDVTIAVIRDNIIRASFLCATGSPSYPEVFIKRYKPGGGLRDSLKYLLLPSKAAAEWRSLRYFEAKGIPCPRPLAFSEKRSRGLLCDSCLITQSLAPALPLHEYLRGGSVAAAQKRRIIETLAQLVATLHGHNIYYRDLHAGNILVRAAADGNAELFCVDLHRALALPVLFEWMAVNDLAQLCNSLPAARTDGIRFLKTYCDSRPRTAGLFHRLQKKIAARRLRLEERRIRSRSKRCVKNSTVFETRRSWHETYYGRRDFGGSAARAAVALHVARRAGSGGTILKAASKSIITVHADVGDQPLCVKGYRFLGPLYSARQALRKSRALRSWIAAHGLLVRGIDTPLPLAVLEYRWGPFVREAFFITRWLPDARELNSYVRHTELGPRKNAFLQALARTLRTMHSRGIYHGDLKSNNILVTDRGPDGWRFWFVDLDRVYFQKTLSFTQRANNLAQINASVAAVMTVRDRLKFFHFYAKGTGFLPVRKKYYTKIMTIGRTKNTEPYGIRFSRTD